MSHVHNGVVKALIIIHFTEQGHTLEDIRFLFCNYKPHPFNYQDVSKILLQQEVQWIFKMQAMTPQGLRPLLLSFWFCLKKSLCVFVSIFNLITPSTNVLAKAKNTCI